MLAHIISTAQLIEQSRAAICRSVLLSTALEANLIASSIAISDARLLLARKTLSDI